MRTFTFRGGVHPPAEKAESVSEPLKKVGLPDELVVPLSQHIGAPCQALVKKNDKVEEGQVIGSSDSFISAVVHAPAAGEVKNVQRRFHPVLGLVPAVVIVPDKETALKEYPAQDPQAPRDAETIISKVAEAGLVGMGGAAFPTHVKLSVPEGKDIRTLIINGAECEPYLTCDQMLMMRKGKEVLEGIKLLMTVLRPGKVYIAIEDNKKAACFAFERLLKKEKRAFSQMVEIAVLKAKYPQGGEKQIIKAITGKEVPPGGLPLDIGFLVQNVGTVNAIYEAVICDKPLIERIITISGDCVAAPRNCIVRVGTPVEALIKNGAVELKKDPEKVIFGGPMMGISQPDMTSPVIKSTSGILFLSKSAAQTYEETVCINCAKCVDVCPVRLLPTRIMKNVKHNRPDELEGLNINDCIECGSCNYICPANIPLVHYIKQGKFEISKKGRM